MTYQIEREGKKMIRRNIVLSGLLLVFLILITKSFDPIWVAGDEVAYDPVVLVSSYRVSNGMITPGERFTLTVEVENKDKYVSNAGLLINISFPDGISTVYPSLSQVFLESVKPGEKKEVEFKLYASPYFAQATAVFGVNLYTASRNNALALYAPVALDKSPFKVVAQSVPEEVGAGEKIAVSFSFRSLLNEKLNNVVLQAFVDDDNKAIATSNIGNISVGAAKTQNTTFFINEIGKHSIRFELAYNTAEGETLTAELYSGEINITESVKTNSPSFQEATENPLTERDKTIILGCLGLSALLAVGIVFIAKKYN